MSNNDSKITVVHVACFRPGGGIGGPYATVSELTRVMHNLGVRIALLRTKHWDFTRVEPFPVFYVEDLLPGNILYALPEPFNSPDLIGFHVINLWQHVVLAWEARRRGIPYIVTPHGSMTKGAQSQKRLKKSVANFLVQNDMINNAKAIRCLTENEAADSRGRWSPRVFVAGNGVESCGVLVKEFRKSENPDVELRLLFLGRLDINHKGLDLLLEGLAHLRQQKPDQRFRLSLAGPDHKGDKARVEGIVKQFALSDVVEFLGVLQGKAKEDAFQRADVFVHTSRFEGQPMSVLEALMRGLPCLLTPGTNLAEQVVAAGAGWSVLPTTEGIAAGLSKVLASRSELAKMGRAARIFAESEFGWNHMAQLIYRNYLEAIEEHNR